MRAWLPQTTVRALLPQGVMAHAFRRSRDQGLVGLSHPFKNNNTRSGKRRQYYRLYGLFRIAIALKAPLTPLTQALQCPTKGSNSSANPLIFARPFRLPINRGFQVILKPPVTNLQTSGQAVGPVEPAVGAGGFLLLLNNQYTASPITITAMIRPTITPTFDLPAGGGVMLLAVIVTAVPSTA